MQPVHRRKPRSYLNIGQHLKGLSIFDIGQSQQDCPFSISGSALRPVFSRRHVPVVNHESCGDCLWPLSCRAHFQLTAGLSRLLQRRCNHTQEPPVVGHVGLRGSCPRTGNIRVASDQALSGRLGVVPRDRFAQADLPASAARWSETLTRKENTYARPELPTQATLPQLPGGRLWHPEQARAHAHPDGQSAPRARLSGHEQPAP